jgi:hypothetical protein
MRASLPQGLIKIDIRMLFLAESNWKDIEALRRVRPPDSGFRPFPHSVRSASSGSSRAAFMAGATPAAMPISKDTRKAAAI